MLPTYKQSCPGLDVAVMAVQIVDGLRQVDAKLLLAVCHLARGEPTRHCQAPRPLPASPPWGEESVGGQLPQVLITDPAPSPLTRQVQRKWRALRPLSQASVQNRVCRGCQRSSTAQR